MITSNRTAAFAAFIAGLAGCATSLAGVWPSTATDNIALIAGGVATIAGPIAHVIGSWLWDRTPAGQAKALASTRSIPPVVGPEPPGGHGLAPDPPGSQPDVPVPQ